MNQIENLREKLDRNNGEISRLKDENRLIVIQMWEDKYKDKLGRNGYLSLDIIMMLFEFDNNKAIGLCGFKEEVYSNPNTIYGLLECAEEYKLCVPEIVWDVVCSNCVCCGCECNCSGLSCDECRENYGCRYHSYCDD